MLWYVVSHSILGLAGASILLETTLHNLTQNFFSWQSHDGIQLFTTPAVAWYFLLCYVVPSLCGGLFLSRRDIVGFHPTFSRHGIVQASLTLLIWLNENVVLCCDMLFPSQFVTLLVSPFYWKQLFTTWSQFFIDGILLWSVVPSHRGGFFLSRGDIVVLCCAMLFLIQKKRLQASWTCSRFYGLGDVVSPAWCQTYYFTSTFLEVPFL